MLKRMKDDFKQLTLKQKQEVKKYEVNITALLQTDMEVKNRFKIESILDSKIQRVKIKKFLNKNNLIF